MSPSYTAALRTWLRLTCTPHTTTRLSLERLALRLGLGTAHRATRKSRFQCGIELRKFVGLGKDLDLFCVCAAESCPRVPGRQ